MLRLLAWSVLWPRAGRLSAWLVCRGNKHLAGGQPGGPGRHIELQVLLQDYGALILSLLSHHALKMPGRRAKNVSVLCDGGALHLELALLSQGLHAQQHEAQGQALRASGSK